MTNRELLRFALSFAKANIEDFYDMIYPESHNSLEARFAALEIIVQEDWVSLMEIIRQAGKSQRIFSTIAGRMDLSDEEMNRLLEVTRILQEE